MQREGSGGNGGGTGVTESPQHPGLRTQVTRQERGAAPRPLQPPRSGAPLVAASLGELLTRKQRHLPHSPCGALRARCIC